ncbi:MAG: 2-C-methyl-D-erythritol 4-phosphate cytidylyltransferase [Bacteroides sp.]|nr:2-C-methyl-D-erythritol 4-phosphate cytidylyltransferase [Bacteroides sp.]MCM1378908.1 2-C-methyl-D-erythritol 4-phosphate cytidylyltransferase [Bacteroides sp.]MCM1445524.1 2-C-methyl-D-erythritol 4-phosphate cytidylyltransferase [Prevotella sp.]
MDKRAIVIVAAGGIGSRFGADRPKQFCGLGGRTVLEHTCERFAGMQLVVVIDPKWTQYVPEGALTALPGKTRWESVKNAIEASRHLDADVIMVHDGARPLVSTEIIARILDACREHQGAIPVVSVTDSLRRVDGTPANRADFRAVQTPQGFQAELLRKAYDLPERPEFTDDAAVMTAAGYDDIAMVDGETSNIKITHPIDLKIAELWMQQLT